jgi:RND family efflux transporter MFP subunit
MRQQPIRLLIVLSIAFLAILPGNWQSYAAPAPPKAAQDVTPDTALHATLVAVQRAFVSSNIPGRIIKLVAKEGDFVERGDVIALLDEVPARLALQSSQARLQGAIALATQARQELDSTQQLFDGEAATQQELQRAQTALLVAEARVAEQRAEHAIAAHRLECCTLRSPIGGRLTHHHKLVGQGVLAFESISEVADPRKLLAVIRVPAQFAEQLSPGYLCRFESGGELRRKGVVETIAIEANPGSEAVTVKVRIPNEDGQLRPGGHGKVLLGGN